MRAHPGLGNRPRRARDGWPQAGFESYGRLIPHPFLPRPSRGPRRPKARKPRDRTFEASGSPCSPVPEFTGWGGRSGRFATSKNTDPLPCVICAPAVSLRGTTTVLISGPDEGMREALRRGFVQAAWVALAQQPKFRLLVDCGAGRLRLGCNSRSGSPTFLRRFSFWVHPVTPRRHRVKQVLVLAGTRCLDGSRKLRWRTMAAGL